MSKIRGYKIIKTLGHGGMATVYLAVQKSVDRYVALKVMSPELVTEKSFTARFLSEARIAARFRHPNIVAIHDVNVENGLPYIAMEYVPGGSLDDERIKNMSLLQKLAMLAQVADALGFLHQKKFIHRDVKPDNVIFREDDTAVLTDFGIARDESSDLSMTKTGSVIGTPYYMSPEQARGKKLDARSDLYSLGVMLYKVLTGKLPFDAEDALSIYIMHAKEAVPDLPDEYAMLDPVVKRLMQKSPGDRYPNTDTLIHKLATVADTSPSRLLNRSFEGVALEITGETDAEDDSTPQDRDQNPNPEAVSEQTAVLETSDPKLLARAGEAPQKPKPDDESASKTDLLIHRAQLLWHDARNKLEPGLARFRLWLKPVKEQIVKTPGLAIAAASATLILLLVVMLPGRDKQNIDSVEGMLARALQIAGSNDQLQRLEAETMFNRVLQQDPSNAAAQAGLEAIAALNDHYSSAPGSNETDNNLETNAVPRTEQAVQRLLSEGARALDEGRLTWPDQDNAYTKFRTALELAPANRQAQEGLQAVADELVRQIGNALDAGDRERAASLLSDARRIGQGGTAAYRELKGRYDSSATPPLDKVSDIEALLARGNAHLQADRLMKPENDNAVSVFQAVLQIDPSSRQARAGLDRVAQRYLELATQAADDTDLQQAKAYLKLAIGIAPLLPGASDLAQRLERELQAASQEMAIAETIEVAALPQPALSGEESASILFRRAEANLKTNNQLLAYALYQQVLVQKPNHRAARRRLYLGAGQYIRLASRDIGDSKLESARKRLSLAAAIDPAHPKLAAVQRAYRTSLEYRATTAAAPDRPDGLAEMRLKLLLSSADTAHTRYTSDPSNHHAANEAESKYLEVLKAAPGNRQARAGLKDLGQSLLEAGHIAVSRQQFEEANWCLAQAREVIPGDPGIDLLIAAIDNEQEP